MDRDDNATPLVTEPISVTIMNGELVLIGGGVACSMTPDAARESARRMIKAADELRSSWAACD